MICQTLPIVHRDTRVSAAKKASFISEFLLRRNPCSRSSNVFWHKQIGDCFFKRPGLNSFWRSGLNGHLNGWKYFRWASYPPLSFWPTEKPPTWKKSPLQSGQPWASERKMILHIFEHNHGGISVWVETTLDCSWERNLDTWKRKSMFWSSLLWTELMNLLTDSSTDGFLLIYLFEGCHGLAWRWFETGLTGEPSSQHGGWLRVLQE